MFVQPNCCCLALLSVFLFSSTGTCEKESGPRQCVYYQGISARLSISLADEQPVVRLSTIKDDQGHPVNVTTCRKTNDSCYAFWKDDNQTSPTILSQGCWESSSYEDCHSAVCLSMGVTSKVLHQSRFCCCSGHLCNLRMSVASDTPVAVQTHDPVWQTVPFLAASRGLSLELVVIITCVAVVTLVVVVSMLFVLRTCMVKWRKNVDQSQHNLSDRQSQQPLTGAGPYFDSLKLIDIIGQGRYGTVWKASLGEKHVAVKVFSSPGRCYYYSERLVYSLPFMEHANIISYLGFHEVNLASTTEYRLVLEYAPYGCLQDYLRQNSVDWGTLCRMGKSISSGLAHLHTDYQRGDLVKMCVAHRDVNSRNVLVKADLTCCLCDLGFAMEMSGAHYYHNGEQQHAETTSLSDVGTLRYMAPEILEGAVNLRECESSLKQIDVYALGLVLWEISNRCYELYPNKEAPAYQLPFEEETGPHATLDQMKTLVCRHKARPLIPDAWRDNVCSVRLLRATLEDAWDQDAEARLTSLCVEERWAELPLMWEREKHKGFSPTLHPNVTAVAPVTTTMTSGPEIGSLGSPQGVAIKNNCAPVWPPSPRLVQPHQGRNPCMERNTNVAPTEEYSVSGNALVNRSTKHIRPAVDQHQQLADNARLLRLDSVATSYVPRIANPIPYVQNDVREQQSSGGVGGGSRMAAPRGLGRLLRSMFGGSSRLLNTSANVEEYEEQQRLCPVLSSPSSADVPELATTVLLAAKTNNNQVAAAAAGRATQVRCSADGYASVTLLKRNTECIRVTNPAFSESSAGTRSPLPAEFGIAKLHAALPDVRGCSPKLMRRHDGSVAARGSGSVAVRGSYSALELALIDD